MASKTNSTLAHFLALSLLFFVAVSERCGPGCPNFDQNPNPLPNPNPNANPAPAPTTSNSAPTPTPDPSPAPALTPDLNPSENCPANLGICSSFPLSGACCAVFPAVTDATDAANCLCAAFKDYPFELYRNQLIQNVFVQCGKVPPSNLNCFE